MSESGLPEWWLADEQATLALGAHLAKAIRPGLTIWLVGDLGAGKTTLTRGLLRGLDYRGRVKSPTYTLVEIYPFSSFNLYHFDLYRFIDPSEWHDAGFGDYFNPHSVCLVEWPEKGGDELPPADLIVRLEVVGDGRQARLTVKTEEGGRCVRKLLESCSGS